MIKSNVLPSIKKDADKKKIQRKIKSTVTELINSYRDGDEMRISHVLEAEEIITGLIFSNKKKKKQIKLLTSILISASCQSGKTGLIIALSRLLKALNPKLKIYVFCANEQREYKDQINNALGGLIDVKYLSLRERGRIIENVIKLNTSEPYLLILDESHYGECTYQTVFKFLVKCGVFLENKDGSLMKNPSFRNLLVCVSATGFSGFEFVDKQYVRDIKGLKSYNSITQLIADKKIYDCDKFVIEDKGAAKVQTKSNVINYLDECHNNFMKKKIKECYAILRCRNKKHSEALQKWLVKKYGSNVNIVYWNQRSPLPSGYLNRPRQVFTVILIQNMARMGITINTEFIALMAEHPSNNLATIVQSVMGRAAGFNKKNHNIRIFSSTQHAKAYSLHEQGYESAFNEFCIQNKIKLSNRCKFKNVLDSTAVKIQHYLFPANCEILLSKVKESQIDNIKKTAKRLGTSIVDESIKLLIRTKFKRKDDFPIRCEDSTSKERVRIKNLFNPLAFEETGGITATAGSIAGIIYKATSEKEVKTYKIHNLKKVGHIDGKCKLVKIVTRLEEGNAYKTLIKPKDESMYSLS